MYYTVTLNLERVEHELDVEGETPNDALRTALDVLIDLGELERPSSFVIVGVLSQD